MCLLDLLCVYVFPMEVYACSACAWHMFLLWAALSFLPAIYVRGEERPATRGGWQPAHVTKDTTSVAVLLPYANSERRTCLAAWHPMPASLLP